MVVAQHLGEHLALVEDHLLVQGAADRLCRTAFDLAPALLRVEHHSGVCGLHRLQDAHLASGGIDRDTKRMDVEGDRARGAVLSARGAQWPSVDGDDPGEVDELRARLHTLRSERALGDIGVECTRCNGEDLAAQLSAREAECFAGDHRTG